jgi:ATP-dependent Lon protease
MEDAANELEDALFDSLQKDRKKKKSLPTFLNLFPLLKRPYFPGMAAPLYLEPGPYYETLKVIAKSPNNYVGLVLTKSETIDINKITFDDLHNVGVVARILRIIPLEQGGAQAILNMEGRIELVQAGKKTKSLSAIVKHYKEEVTLTKEVKAYAISIISTIKELLKQNPLFKEELQIFLTHSDFTEPGKLADFAVALTTANREELQDILSTFDLQNRITKALVLLRKELDLSKLQHSISKKIESSLNKAQREFYLREQLRTIKKELGLEKDDKVLDHDKFKERLKDKTVPEEAQKVIQEEMEKFSTIDNHSPEYGILRNYIDTLTSIPWGIKSPDIHNLKQAEAILEKDHYGLEDIKKRIIEFIGVSKLSGKLKGTILCLVGPPGVGKTSVGKSIAHALGRKFFRFSVGGMRDEAEIKGHRRTYIGAMPGKIIQALKTCQTMNPVIMLDEIDKIGASYQGDPASSLLEVLDPEQNVDFLDHYLDVRCDLSDVLFIVTANTLDDIPDPLLDRMDIMRLSGYVLEEKAQIAKGYLIPKQREAAGLKPEEVLFEKDSLEEIINSYAREAGVRGLENCLKKIFRKIAVNFVKMDESQKVKEPVHITVSSLKDYLGKPVFLSDQYYKKTPPGVAVGLAWTSHGGATLYVESIKREHDKTEMKLTGQPGDVMKESSEIAWSFLHASLGKYAPKASFFDKSQVHIHLPEGATPKDGPSAGITLVTSLLSLLLNKPIKQNLAMTGELTLTGKVLPIGGVKEKLVAAKRCGIKKVIIPKGNSRDLDELQDHIKKGLDIHLVDHYDEVYAIAFERK